MVGASEGLRLYKTLSYGKTNVIAYVLIRKGKCLQ